MGVKLHGGSRRDFERDQGGRGTRLGKREIDYYWEKLAADGGGQIQCGWLKDRFGMRWQIHPKQIWDWLSDNDPARVPRVTAAFWAMEKIDLAELERAAEKN